MGRRRSTSRILPTLNNVWRHWKTDELVHVPLAGSNKRRLRARRSSHYRHRLLHLRKHHLRRKDGKSNNKGGKGKGKRSSKGKVSGGSGPKKFADIMKGSPEDKAWLHQKFHAKEVCYDFQKKNCRHSSEDCKWEHVRAGCGGSRPYDECLCLADRLKHN